MRQIAVLGWVMLPLVVLAPGPGCSSPSSNSDDDAASSSSLSSGSAAGGSAAGGSAAGGGAATLPVCLAICNTAADCSQGSPAFDENNYSCDAGHCNYTGCVDDAECQGQGNLVCRTGFDPFMLGSSKICVFACLTPTDCDFNTGPAWDADNYDCVDGGCQYTGCNNEAECAAQPGDLTCRDTGAGVSFCQTACNTAADCDIGGGIAYDGDNYVCDSGVCAYQGCNDNNECMSLGAFDCVGN